MFENWKIEGKNHPSRIAPFELGYWKKRLEEAKTPEERLCATDQVGWWSAAIKYWDEKKHHLPAPSLRDEPGPLLM